MKSLQMLPLSCVNIVSVQNVIEDVKSDQMLLPINSAKYLQTVFSTLTSETSMQSSQKLPLKFEETGDNETTESSELSPVTIISKQEEEITIEENNVEELAIIESAKKVRKEKQKRVNLTLKEKIHILDEIKKDRSTMSRFSLMYNLDRETIRKWKQKEQKMRNALNKTNNKNCRRVRQETFNSLMSKAVYKWFKENAKQGMTFTGPIVRRKALEINKKLGGRKDFIASDGWLTNWKKKYNISQFTYTGNSNDESTEEDNYENEDTYEGKKEENENISEQNNTENKSYEQSENIEDEIEEIFEECELKPCIYNSEISEISDDQAIDCLEKSMKYFESNEIATVFEMNVLLRLKLKAEELKVSKSHKSNNSPEFFACQ